VLFQLCFARAGEIKITLGCLRGFLDETVE
jgi:hypothetical protein